MAAPSTTTSAQPDDGYLPAGTLRTVVTLLLLWHLFAVGLAWVTDMTPVTSQVLFQTKENTPLVSPYLRALWLDVGYGFRWTYAQPNDVGCSLVADVFTPDKTERRILPAADKGGRQRAQYEQLANEAGSVGVVQGSDEAEESTSRILTMVGGQLMRELGSDKVEISVRRPREDRLEGLIVMPQGRRDPTNENDYETVFRAAITRAKDGTLSLIKLEAAGRSSPVTAPAGGATPGGAAPGGAAAPATGAPATGTPVNPMPIKPFTDAPAER